MKKHIKRIALLLVINLSVVKAQVGISTNNPNKSAVLDISETNKGLLIPRVQLQSTVDITTVLNPATGLLVYNTNNSLSTGLGFYFYSGSSGGWQKLITATEASYDNLGNHTATQNLAMQGNKINFDNVQGVKIGLLDDVVSATINQGTNGTMEFQTGSKSGSASGLFSWWNYGATPYTTPTEQMRVNAAGRLGVGTTNPGNTLDVAGTSIIDQTLIVKTTPGVVSGDVVMTVGDDGTIKKTASAIPMRAGYTFTGIASGQSQTQTILPGNSLIITITTKDACGVNVTSTFFRGVGGVITFLGKISGKYNFVVTDPNGSQLKLTYNPSVSCTDNTLPNFAIGVSGNDITITNNSVSTTQNYAMRVVQLGV